MKTKKRLGAGRGEGKGNDGIVLTIKGASFLMISHVNLLWEMSKKKKPVDCVRFPSGHK